MSALKEILTRLHEKRAEAAVDPTELDPRVRSSGEGMIRAAGIAVKEIEKEYKTAVIRSAIIIAVTGPGAEAFAKIAEEKFKTVSVDYLAATKSIAASIQKRSGQTTYGTHEHFMMLSELQALKIKNDIIRIPVPQVNAHDNVWHQPLETALDRLFVKNYEGSLYSAVSLRQIESKALEEEFSGKTLPVVLFNTSVETDRNFLPPTFEKVEAPEEVTEEFVKTKLFEVKKKLKAASN